MRQRKPRIKDEEHLAWIRTLPCILTGRTEGVEAAHIRFSDMRFAKRSVGKGERPDDKWVVPLHHEKHREQHLGNERTFWKDQNTDPVMVAAALYLNSGDDDAALLIWESLEWSRGRVLPIQGP